jgi:CheY-like chemotaxis protein
VLSIADTGVGMDTATLGHLFEPFFSTKQSGEHAGLGLAMLHGIVSQNGGFIEVKSRPGEGTTFELHLPKAFSAGRTARPSEAPQPVTGERLPPSSPGVETVLFVEDEEANLRIGQRILENAGYSVLAASSAAQALAILEKTERPVHTMICDVALQKISARELVEAVRRRFPDVGVLYVSGYPKDMVLDRGWIQEGQRFLPKPFSGAQLLEAVRSLHGQRS